MRFLVALNFIISATTTGRGSRHDEEAKLVAKSDQLRLQKAKPPHNASRYESLDTPNTPDTWASEPGAFTELRPKLKPRQTDTLNTYVSTCGYLNGDANLPRTANLGFDCRVDTKNAIWGFCPTTIVAVSNCGLVGGCVDAHACNTGCGISGDPSITTFTCTSFGAHYCSTALLTDGPDQTYSYIACGSAPVTDNLLYSPKTTSLPSSTSSTSALSAPKPSVTSASSTSSATSSSPISTTSIISSASASSSPISTTSISSSASASSSTLSKVTPSPSNNTGAIVGGVLGGLALLAFVVVAILFHRRLKTSPTNEAYNNDPVLQDIEFQRAVPKKAPRQTFPLAELPSDTPPTELSSGRHDETTELPNDREGIRRI